jgi:hypothetical protein
MNRTENQIYEVSKYTDKELFDILDLINPTDRELEAKIIFLYERYRNMQNKSGNELAKFFKDIYERFFGLEEEEAFEVEGYEDYNNNEFTDQRLVEGFEEGDTTIDTTNGVTDTVEPVETVETGETTETVEPTETTETVEPTETVETKGGSRPSTIGFTKQLMFTPDKLNPTLNQTIKRIISVDSQYRDDKTTLSTEFTFNLSEPLRDVLSLKLYSIQVPRTWYTVSTNYGCNFFFLKGNAPGINDGNFDFQIDIPPGNYTAPTIISALNVKVQNLKTTYTDISFGETRIDYNPDNAIASITIDIKKHYNENSYYLYFPTWSYPKTDASGTSSIYNSRYQTIPAFLGYNYNQYYTDILYSSPNLPLTTDTTEASNDAVNGLYYIDDMNNFITIIRYIGPDEYVSGTSMEDLSFNITLSVSGIVTRNSLVDDLNYQLSQNTYLSEESQITRVNVTDPSLNGFGNSFYKLKIKFSRFTTNNIENSKTYVLFPQEIPSASYNKTWTGATSCFRFESLTNEMNNIISETTIIDQQSGKYIITNNPYIYLKCTKPNYDVSQNDYKITINNSTAGYTLADYITAINTAVITENGNTILANPKKTLGDFNTTYMKGYIDTTDSTFKFQVDLNRSFTEDMYYLDIKGGLLTSLLDMSGDYLHGKLNLTANNTLSDQSGNIYSYVSVDNGTYTFQDASSNTYTFFDKDDEIIRHISDFSYNLPNTTIYLNLASAFTLAGSTLKDISENIIYDFSDNDTQNIYNYYSTTNNITYGYYDMYLEIPYFMSSFISEFVSTTDNTMVVNLAYLTGSYSYESYEYFDLSGSGYVFQSSFNDNTQYIIDSSYLLIAHPSLKNYGNQNAGTFKISTDGIYTTHPTGILYRYQDIETEINKLFTNYTDSDGTKLFLGSNIKISPNEATDKLDCTFTIVMRKTLSQTDYKIGFFDASYSRTTTSYTDSTWFNNLNIGNTYLSSAYGALGGIELNTIDTDGKSYTKLVATKGVTINTIQFTDNSNNIFYIKPYEYGVTSIKGENDIQFKIPAVASDGITPINYTRDQLLVAINTALANNELTYGSSISVIKTNNNEYTKMRININKYYYTADYNLVFYDQTSFMKCYTGVKSVKNTTWDTTIGWLIGFHDSTSYNLSLRGTRGSIVTLAGDTTVSVNLYNYFLICLDDFNQNHLNDGLVTVASNNTDITLPSYANRTKLSCDPVTNLLVYDSTPDETTYNQLTQNQIRAITENANAKRQSSIISNTGDVSAKSYGSGPFVQDVFAYIPMKIAGLDNGSVYVDYGGTLQNQERTYFGPVNLSRMRVRLVSDRGDVVNLNGSNWSFSLICEQLYQQKPMGGNK